MFSYLLFLLNIQDHGKDEKQDVKRRKIKQEPPEYNIGTFSSDLADVKPPVPIFHKTEKKEKILQDPRPIVFNDDDPLIRQAYDLIHIYSYSESIPEEHFLVDVIKDVKKIPVASHTSLEFECIHRSQVRSSSSSSMQPNHTKDPKEPFIHISGYHVQNFYFVSFRVYYIQVPLTLYKITYRSFDALMTPLVKTKQFHNHVTHDLDKILHELLYPTDQNLSLPLHNDAKNTRRAIWVLSKMNTLKRKYHQCQAVFFHVRVLKHEINVIRFIMVLLDLIIVDDLALKDGIDKPIKELMKIRDHYPTAERFTIIELFSLLVILTKHVGSVTMLVYLSRAILEYPLWYGMTKHVEDSTSAKAQMKKNNGKVNDYGLFEIHKWNSNTDLLKRMDVICSFFEAILLNRCTDVFYQQCFFLSHHFFSLTNPIFYHQYMVNLASKVCASKYQSSGKTMSAADRKNVLDLLPQVMSESDLMDVKETQHQLYGVQYSPRYLEDILEPTNLRHQKVYDVFTDDPDVDKELYPRIQVD